PRAGSATWTWPARWSTSPSSRSCSRPARACSRRPTRPRRACSRSCARPYITPPRDGSRRAAPCGPPDAVKGPKDHAHTSEHRDVTIRPTLCIIPAFVRTEQELDVLLRCLVSLRATAPDAAVLVVDDCSPAQELVAGLRIACDELGIAFAENDANVGFSATVNAGLQLALAMEHDAVLVNADIEFIEAGWLERMRARTDSLGRPAAVVGARLLYPNGLIQHAGIFLSPLHRDWLHR